MEPKTETTRLKNLTKTEKQKDGQNNITKTEENITKTEDNITETEERKYYVMS